MSTDKQDPAEVAAEELSRNHWIGNSKNAKSWTERIIREAYAAREAELLDKLARANFFLDCHTTGERGANHCGFEGTHVCTVCHNADLEAELAVLRDGLQRIVKREMVVEGLRPEFYGYARQIAKETLKAVQAEGSDVE